MNDGKAVNTALIKNSLYKIAENVPFQLPAMSWRLAAELPENG